MSLWLTSGGKIAVTTGGAVLECVDCPCGTVDFGCGACSGEGGAHPQAAAVRVTISGVVGVGDCEDCDTYNGEFELLPYAGGDPEASPLGCGYELALSICGFSGPMALGLTGTMPSDPTADAFTLFGPGFECYIPTGRTDGAQFDCTSYSVSATAPELEFGITGGCDFSGMTVTVETI